MKEEWRDVEGYEGLYQVSNYGRVKSLERYVVKERILRPGNVNGYMAVNLYSENGKNREYIHRLVAKAFIDNPNNLPYVNHRDENKANNYAENLEWCTPKYNVNYGSSTKRRIHNTDFKAINESRKKPVTQYSLEGKFIARYDSLSECGRLTGFDISRISKACRGILNSAYRSIWKYEN